MGAGRLTHKTALVTGAGRGIGRGIAVTLAAEGADLFICDMAEELLRETADLVTSYGRRCEQLVVDLSQSDDAEWVVGTAIEMLGCLDVLVNNAGINRDAMLHNMTNEQWDLVLAVDLRAVFLTTRAAARHMRERGSGRIINISSGAWLGNVGQANYAAAKAGVVGLTLTAARELARKGVTANAICPGFIDTAMTRGIPEHVREDVLRRIPMGRPGQPDDVGHLVAFLASDAAGYITGQVIDVSGGYIV
ncbi:MAG TPA: 3-oxoacyl-ACP reductase FabG [Chloroflexota bacterium]|nr:3-oxoacyl-ACP reductase FabG [Chloroflexota bacterium]